MIDFYKPKKNVYKWSKTYYPRIKNVSLMAQPS